MKSTKHSDRFGKFGGRYVPETLIPALDELDEALESALADEAFIRSVDEMLSSYVGRPSPLSAAPRLSERVGAEVFLKREDLNHTGAHKINNTVGQALLALRMGKRRIIAETELASTELRQPPCARGSGSTASCTWAKKTSSGSRSTCTA